MTLTPNRPECVKVPDLSRAAGRVQRPTNAVRTACGQVSARPSPSVHAKFRCIRQEPKLFPCLMMQRNNA
ncbi:hypothetical protein MTBLM5_170075 [Magnetospirillum sp. LM-5]|nr:hypothetical protein MTBLM5_170075 [Magnetospirillum sp. LM-5]